MLHYREDLKTLARQLRSGMTDAERILWARLRAKQLERVQFYRQRPVGEYIVDFYAPSAGLVIEVDGGQHLLEEGRSGDAARDRYLESCGLRVLRFTNNEVLGNIDGVLEVIWRAL
jgi:very-short-patch-repair endonuclease